MTENRNHNADGKFSKGNQAAKKDMTKEMAKDMVSKELWWISNLMCNTPQSKVEEMLKGGKLDDESLMCNAILKGAAQGNSKMITWFAEMMVGKATQQVETKITEHSITINIDQDDADM